MTDRPNMQEVQLLSATRKESGELVVRLRYYEGRPFVDVRMWQNGKPTSKGTSIRIHEIDQVVAALQRAKELVPKREPRPAPTRCPDCGAAVEHFDKVCRNGARHVGVRCPNQDCQRDWIQWIRQDKGAA